MNKETIWISMEISILLILLILGFGYLNIKVKSAQEKFNILKENRSICYEARKNEPCGKEKCNYDYNNDWRINYEQLLLEKYQLCLMENNMVKR